LGSAENDGHENDGHENAGHVSGVYRPIHGIDCDLAVLPSNRLLLRFQECSRSEENEPDKRKTITGGLYNLPRCCDLYSAVVLKRIAHCIVM